MYCFIIPSAFYLNSKWFLHVLKCFENNFNLIWKLKDKTSSYLFLTWRPSSHARPIVVRWYAPHWPMSRGHALSVSGFPVQYDLVLHTTVVRRAELYARTLHGARLLSSMPPNSIARMDTRNVPLHSLTMMKCVSLPLPRALSVVILPMPSLCAYPSIHYLALKDGSAAPLIDVSAPASMPCVALQPHPTAWVWPPPLPKRQHLSRSYQPRLPATAPLTTPPHLDLAAKLASLSSPMLGSVWTRPSTAAMRTPAKGDRACIWTGGCGAHRGSHGGRGWGWSGCSVRAVPMGAGGRAVWGLCRLAHRERWSSGCLRTTRPAPSESDRYRLAFARAGALAQARGGWEGGRRVGADEMASESNIREWRGSFWLVHVW